MKLYRSFASILLFFVLAGHFDNRVFSKINIKEPFYVYISLGDKQRRLGKYFVSLSYYEKATKAINYENAGTFEFLEEKLDFIPEPNFILIYSFIILTAFLKRF